MSDLDRLLKIAEEERERDHNFDCVDCGTKCYYNYKYECNCEEIECDCPLYFHKYYCKMGDDCKCHLVRYNNKEKRHCCQCAIRISVEKEKSKVIDDDVLEPGSVLWNLKYKKI